MAMTCRFELFVADVNATIAFYTDVLGFNLDRRDETYASLVHGQVTIGVGRIADLPEHGDGPGFTQQRVVACRGAGVEIVLETTDLDSVYAHVIACGQPVVDHLRQRPWGLRDFRIADPDGYYLRITHP
jgi:lactoylglutathione lyase